MKVDSSHHGECAKMCSQLDRIAPYNTHIVFVCSYFNDGQTSLDFLARLGNFCQLKLYSQYFEHLDNKAKQTLTAMEGIVFDRDLNDIFVFVTDMFLQPDTDLSSLLAIPNLSTIYLCSMFLLGCKSISLKDTRPDSIASITQS